MQNLLLTIARFALAAWVGAASLFVVASLREVRYPDFDTVTKNALALIRFPAYYAFGFALVGAALVCGLLVRRRPGPAGARLTVAMGLTAFALSLMLIDYVWIYRPLAEMIALVEEARPASFTAYHKYSMWINTADVGLCLIAALLICWPEGPSRQIDKRKDSR